MKSEVVNGFTVAGVLPTIFLSSDRVVTATFISFSYFITSRNMNHSYLVVLLLAGSLCHVNVTARAWMRDWQIKPCWSLISFVNMEFIIYSNKYQHWSAHYAECSTSHIWKYHINQLTMRHISMHFELFSNGWNIRLK